MPVVLTVVNEVGWWSFPDFSRRTFKLLFLAGTEALLQRQNFLRKNRLTPSFSVGNQRKWRGPSLTDFLCPVQNNSLKVFTYGKICANPGEIGAILIVIPIYFHFYVIAYSCAG